MKDEKKIAFIIAVNNRTVFEECRKYLERLVLPEGKSWRNIDLYACCYYRTSCF